MNRYVAEGMARDAADGLRVCCLADARTCKAALGMIEDAGLPDGVKVYRAHGRERVEFPSGGRVVFYRSVAAVRGASADVLVIGHSGVVDDPDKLAWVFPVLMGSSVGQVIRAC